MATFQAACRAAITAVGDGVLGAVSLLGAVYGRVPPVVGAAACAACLAFGLLGRIAG